MKAFENDLIIDGDRIIKHQPAISDKALRLNLNKNIYGSFSEIGAGQETVRHFFRAGGSSRTIAKAMSAYDKQFSDAIYTVEPDGRYVTENRLRKMLMHESGLMEERLHNDEFPNRLYFSYANTVATIDFAKKFKGHGWVGIRFQVEPKGEYNEIILHIQFKETDARLQQHTLGVLGVNLIYGAFYKRNNPKRLIDSLYDHIDKDQIEIDSINFSGSCFPGIDNRLMSMYLVKKGFSNAIVFGPKGNSLLPANILYRKNLLLLRGSFRPVTSVNMNMLEKSLELFLEYNKITKEQTTVMFEITLNNLLMEGEIDEQDFIDRAELLCSLGHYVMISNFKKYYKVTEYCSQYTSEKIGLALGANNLENIFDSKYYQHLGGGAFEGLGKLFKSNIQLYLYPMLDKNGNIVTSKNIQLNDADLQPIVEYFVHKKQIFDITDYDPKDLNIHAREVIQKIYRNENDWEQYLPEKIAKLIKEKKLFSTKPEKLEN